MGFFWKKMANGPYFYRLISHPTSIFKCYKGSRYQLKIDSPNTRYFVQIVISFIIVHSLIKDDTYCYNFHQRYGLTCTRERSLLIPLELKYPGIFCQFISCLNLSAYLITRTFLSYSSPADHNLSPTVNSLIIIINKIHNWKR